MKNINITELREMDNEFIQKITQRQMQIIELLDTLVPGSTRASTLNEKWQELENVKTIHTKMIQSIYDEFFRMIVLENIETDISIDNKVIRNDNNQNKEE